MQSAYRKLAIRMRDFVILEGGQDLVEFALVAMLVSTGAVAAISSMSVALVNTYQHIVSVFP